MQKQIDKPIYKKMEKIESEIHDLRLMMLKHLKQETVVPIGGALKGVMITDEQIKEAKTSLFKSGV